MPFLNGLLANQHTRVLTEDLLSRGWVQMLSGKYARDTKAFYMVPQCDGTPNIVFKYNLGMLLDNKEVVPIWEVPPQGTSVGMMNVPTTFPAQEVNGFFVSGAGGGVNKVDGIPDALCHPTALASELSDLGYKIDIRFGTAGIKDIGMLFEQLCDMLEKRADAFLKLLERHQPEFAFLCFRAPTVVQYLAMVEMEAYFERKAGQQIGEHVATQAWSDGFEKLYSTLDHCIQRVMEAAQADHWTISSDHGAVPYKHRLNIHKFLQDHNYQTAKLNIWESVRNIGKTVLRGQPFQLAKKIDFSRATAFGHWYLTGIFINDQKRFGGPVSPSEVAPLVTKICDDFNATEEAKQFEMEARPYRAENPDSKYGDHLADVKIHCSDEIFFSKFPGPFVRPNPDYKPMESIENIKGGMHSGQKGRHPLFCCCSQTAKLIKDDDPLDLTLVYKLTQRVFQNNE